MQVLIWKSIQLINKGTFRPISSCISLGNKDNNHWRKLGQNPNSFGPLTNLPDYTFMDNRPVPLGSNLKKRLNKQKEIAQKIVNFNKELAFAKDRYVRIQQEKSQLLEQKVAKQLKPKGHFLNKDS